VARLILFLILFSYSFKLLASITRYDVFGSQKLMHDFSEVCTYFHPQGSSLIDIVSTAYLDCMGRKIAVADFCDEKYRRDPQYIRAYVDSDLKKVVCQKANRVILSYRCEANNRSKLCLDAKDACQALKSMLAKNLDLVHFSLIKRDETQRDLNCYYDNLASLEKLK
jgi:hypothetical protein